MTKIRSVLLGSMFLAFSHGAFADVAKEPVMNVLIEKCRTGTQCTGDSCVKLEAVTTDKSHIFGFSGVHNGNRLTCGAFMTESFSSSVPGGMLTQFGAFFGNEEVICNNGAAYPIDSDTKVSFSYSTNPNACTVTNIE